MGTVCFQIYTDNCDSWIAYKVKNIIYYLYNNFYLFYTKTVFFLFLHVEIRVRVLNACTCIKRVVLSRAWLNTLWDNIKALIYCEFRHYSTSWNLNKWNISKFTYSFFILYYEENICYGCLNLKFVYHKDLEKQGDLRDCLVLVTVT